MEFYTIGHSNHPLDHFLGLLKDHAITRLMDVCSTPYSRFNPQYNQKALQQSLLEQGISYSYLGDTLGGRPKNPALYLQHTNAGKADKTQPELNVCLVMQQVWFVEGIKDLLALVGQLTTCILCSEKDPGDCHRLHLIARYLLEKHPEVAIWHILADGSLIDAASIPRLDNDQDAGQLSFKV